METFLNNELQPFCESQWNGTKVVGVLQDLSDPDDYVWSVISKTPNADGTLVFDYGFEVEVYRFLRDSFNFTEAAVYGTGYINVTDGILLGMAGQLERGEADIIIASSELLDYRVKALTPLQPTYHTIMWAFFHQPSSTSLKDLYLDSFTSSVWFALLLTWFFLIASFTIINQMKHRFKASMKTDLKRNAKDEMISICDLLSCAIGTTCQQGCFLYSSNLGGPLRLVFITGILLCVIVYSSYTAVFVTFFSFKVDAVKSLSDITGDLFQVYRHEYTFDTERVVHQMEDIRAIPSVPDEQRTRNTIDIFPDLIQGGIAYLAIEDTFYPVFQQMKKNNVDAYRIHDVFCNRLSKVRASERSITSGMWLKKNSKYKECFNRKIALMYENGIIFRNMKTYITDTSFRCIPNVVHQRPANLSNTMTAFFAMCGGVILSLCVFVGERWISKMKMLDPNPSLYPDFNFNGHL